MINVKRLKESVTDQQMLYLMKTLDVEMRKTTPEYYIFESKCCKTNYHNRSPKLYYYKKTHSFYCYSCQFSGDIFVFLQHCLKCSFIQALQYVCDKLGIDAELYERAVPKYNYQWQDYYSQFLTINKSTQQELKVYDDNVLKLFDNRYHSSWIDWGLSMSVMDYFEIKWYSLQQQIVIPVRDANDNLVGIRARNTSPCAKAKYIPLQTLDGEIYSFPTNMILYGEKQNESFIKQSKTLWLVEGEKSVLKSAQWFGINKNPTLAMFGGNLSQYNKEYILRLGVKEVVLIADRDFDSVDSYEYKMWEKKVNRISEQLRNYCNFKVAWDKEFQLNKKENLFDGDKNYFERMIDECK